MRGIDTQVRKTRRAIFREVANLAYHSENIVDDMEALPYKLVDAENSPYWDNIYREREIIRERTRLAMGMSLRPEDELISVALTDGSRELLLGTKLGMSIRFHEDNIRLMGRTAMGVRSIDLDEGDGVVSMSVVDPECQVLTISENGYGKRTPVEEYRVQSRAGKGIKAMQLTDKTGPLAALMLVREDEDVMMISDDGTIIRTAVSELSTQSRSTQGVRVMRLAGDSRVVAVTTAEKIEDSPEEELPADPADAPEQAPDAGAQAGEDLNYQGDEQADLARLLDRAESEDEEI